MKRVSLLVAVLTGAARTAGASCEGATAAVGEHELTRASVELATCEDSGVVSKVDKVLVASDLAEISFVSPTPNQPIAIDELPGVSLPASSTVWLRAGTYHVRSGDAQLVVTAQTRTRSVQIIPAPPKAPPPPRAGSADFTEETAGNTESGPPPDVKHPSLISKRLLGIVEAPSGEVLADPLAAHETRAPWRWSAGLRIAGGMFQQTGADARAGVELGVVVRQRTGAHVLADALMLELRADWSRRGGADAQADAVGVTFGPTATLATAGAIAFRAGLGARGEVRLESSLDAMAVNRFGLDAVAWLDVEPERSPLIFGLRVEQGVTALVGSERDRAVLAQVGVNLR